MAQPDFGLFWIGEVGLIEDLQARLVASQFGKHWVFAAEGNPRVKNFDHQIDFGDRLFHLNSGFVHVPGKPLDLHNALPAGIETTLIKGISVTEIAASMAQIADWFCVGKQLHCL